MNVAQQAVFELDVDEFERLIAQGADLRGTLLAACSAHDPPARLQQCVIRLLAKCGASAEETDKNGVTPLRRVVRFRSPPAV